eukprot:CAMPEP_0168203254 /NCGR_PEP_ID=MMETSP0139_2-20121125/24746_1 /TAXON_ID=44445 /ORGANISM="Pseudo-nitzschia australis, Strain 10249 10 AB" /LENGTH=211 /DNA_ID=CAMNT_0008129073 /DNA_START=83 /DNA_END=719 /DNA_ORIENTATION=-
MIATTTAAAISFVPTTTTHGIRYCSHNFQQKFYHVHATGSSLSRSVSPLMIPPSSSSLSSTFLLSSVDTAEMDTTMFLLPDNPLLRNRSGYRPGNKNNRGDDGKDNDPLPWIKLPRLDFVEVAGQKDLPPPVAAAATIDRKEQQRVYEELENLRLRLNRELENVRKRRQDATGATAIGGQDDVDDDMAEAKRLQNSLEGLMKLYGLEYETE